MMKTKVIVLVMLSCFFHYTWAQTCKIEGTVLDENNQPLDFANVVLCQATDTSYLNGVVTDVSGKFTITHDKGIYLLGVKVLSYQDVFKPITLDKDLNAGVIQLTQGTIGLSEVTVVGAKPIIRREVDRVVFDVNNVVSAHGSNAVDLLQNVPGLMVTHDDISVIGKGSIRVFINEKETRMTGTELLNLLKTYNASTISKIEVITTPPARYEAEGNAGIVNIILKKAQNDYWGGNASLSHNMAEKSSDHLSLNLNYSKGKLATFVNASGGLGKYSYQERNERYFPHQVWESRTDYWNKNNYMSYRAGMDYALNEKTSAGIHASYSQSSPDGDAYNETQITNRYTNSLDSVIRSTNPQHQFSERVTVNYHMDRKLDSIGKKVLFDVDYLSFSRVRDERLNANTYLPNGNILPSSVFGYNNDQTRDIKSYASSLDFLLPFERFTINTGSKISFTDTDNEIKYYNNSEMDDQNDLFRYKENIFALYADFNKELSSKLSVKAGVRLEHTWTEGYSKSLDQTDKNHYTKLFPTAYLTYKPTHSHAFNASFSNRISRPRYNAVNPFNMYQNKYSYAQGKADLKPSYSYNFDLGYTLKNNFNIGFYYSYSQDEISQIIVMDSVTNVMGALWENYITSRNIGINNSYTFSGISWLQTFVQHSLGYTKSTTDTHITTGQKGFAYNINIRNNLYFNRKKTFSGELSGSYSSKQYYGDIVLKPSYHISGGLKYSMLDGKLNFSSNVDNILNTAKMRGTITSNGMDMKINNSFWLRTFRLAVSYNFGAKLSSKSRNYSSSDVQNRL